MSTTATIQLYKFEELDDKARERVKNSEMMNHWQHDHITFFVSDLEGYELPNEGYEEAKIMYSIGFSQGDGLEFTATVPLRKWTQVHGYTLTPEIEELIDGYGWGEDFAVNIEGSRRDAYHKSMHVDPDYQFDLEDALHDGEITEAQADQYRELCGAIQEAAQARAKEIYYMLCDEILRFYDDAFLQEEFFHNEMLFLPNGEFAPATAQV